MYGDRNKYDREIRKAATRLSDIGVKWRLNPAAEELFVREKEIGADAARFIHDLHEDRYAGDFVSFEEERYEGMGGIYMLLPPPSYQVGLTDFWSDAFLEAEKRIGEELKTIVQLEWKPEVYAFSLDSSVLSREQITELKSLPAGAVGHERAEGKFVVRMKAFEGFRNRLYDMIHEHRLAMGLDNDDNKIFPFFSEAAAPYEELPGGQETADREDLDTARHVFRPEVLEVSSYRLEETWQNALERLPAEYVKKLRRSPYTKEVIFRLNEQGKGGRCLLEEIQADAAGTGRNSRKEDFFPDPDGGSSDRRRKEAKKKSGFFPPT